MFSDADAQQAFPELVSVASLGVNSGQKFVYRAELKGQRMALKIVPPSAGGAARLAREIAAVAALSSVYVPRVHSHGTRPVKGTDCFFLIEQFIEGGSYRSKLAAQPVQSLSSVLDVGASLIAACVDFEAARLVHRDIKPDNVMVDAAGKLWVIDFGLVRFLDWSSLTATAAAVGPCTPGYGAPEQVRNDKSQITVRADLFAVGVTMYEALTGTHPYHQGKNGNLFAVLEHVRNQDLLPLSHAEDKNGQLRDFLAAMTARYPSRRPGSAAEARDWLKEVRARIGQ
jgi:serine/threonine protein kinase